MTRDRQNAALAICSAIDVVHLLAFLLFFVVTVATKKFGDIPLLSVDVYVEFPLLLIDERLAVDSAGVTRIGQEYDAVIVERRGHGDGQILYIAWKVLQLKLLPEHSFDVAMLADIDPIVLPRSLGSVCHLLFEIAESILDIELRMPVFLGIPEKRDGLAVDEPLPILGRESRA